MLLQSPFGNCQVFSMTYFKAVCTEMYRTKLDGRELTPVEKKISKLNILEVMTYYFSKPLLNVDIKMFQELNESVQKFIDEYVIQIRLETNYKSSNGSIMRMFLLHLNLTKIVVDRDRLMKECKGKFIIKHD